MLTSGQFYVGVAFAAATLLFLYRVFFHKSSAGPMDPARRSILDVVCALCAGAAGAFIAGSYVDVHVQSADSHGVYRLASGFVLFAMTFFGLRLTGPSVPAAAPPAPPPVPPP